MKSAMKIQLVTSAIISILIDSGDTSASLFINGS